MSTNLLSVIILGLEKSYIPTSTKMDEAKKSPIYNTFAKELCDDNCKLSTFKAYSEHSNSLQLTFPHNEIVSLTHPAKIAPRLEMTHSGELKPRMHTPW